MQVTYRRMSWGVGGFIMAVALGMISGWASASAMPRPAAAPAADSVLTSLRHDCKLLAGMQQMAITSREQHHWFQAEIKRQGQAAAATASLWDYFADADKEEPPSKWHERLRKAFEVELRRLPLDLAMALEAEAEKLDPEGLFFASTSEGLTSILLAGAQYLQPEAYSFIVAAETLSAGLHTDCLAKMNALLP